MNGSIIHWIYTGDTILHVLAAAHRFTRIKFADRYKSIVNDNRNRRKATPLHYAADAIVDSDYYNSVYQRNTIKNLVRLGAAVNALDANGATPLMRAVRCRSYVAVVALVEMGAAINGSDKIVLLKLARVAAGRGFSGMVKAKVNQQKIISYLSAIE